MNIFLLILILIIINFLILIPLSKIVYNDKMNNDLLFIYLSNIILTIAFLLFFMILDNYFFTFYIAFFQMIFAYLLIFNIKNILGKYNFISLPYFVVWVFIFAKLFIIYLF